MDISTPCHVIDLDKLRSNLEFPIKYIREETKCHVLLAIKGFSAPSILSYMRDGLDGISASGLYEARLGKEAIDKFVCTFSPAYQIHNFNEVAQYSDAIVFNSIKQFSMYNALAYKKGCTCGIRINLEYSELPENFDANPNQKYSRLGIKFDDMPSISMFETGKIEGIHLHTMCEQGADTLERTICVLIEKYDLYLRRIQWLNLGGGQMYAKNDYDVERAIRSLNVLRKRYDVEVYLEPCAGIMSDCGYYATTVVDIVQNEMNIAILDGSSICHMPDAVYRGWHRRVRGADGVGINEHNYRLTGPSCFPGDIWGDYSFPEPLNIGDLIIFEDAAHYTSVKSSMFNGLPLPTLATYNKAEGFKIKKEYGYEHFISCQ